MFTDFIWPWSRIRALQLTIEVERRITAEFRRMLLKADRELFLCTMARDTARAEIIKLSDRIVRLEGPPRVGQVEEFVDAED